MQQPEFEKLFHETMARMNQLLIVKGGEYAGSFDRLGNFKRGRERTGASPMQTLWIYAAKHIDSIETFIKDDASGKSRPRSEPIEGRVHDLMNYCLLLLAIIQERNKPEGYVNALAYPTPEEALAKMKDEYAKQTTIADRDHRILDSRFPDRTADRASPVPPYGTPGHEQR